MQMKFCPYCGEPLPLENAKFCPECGERLGAPERPAPGMRRPRPRYEEEEPPRARDDDEERFPRRRARPPRAEEEEPEENGQPYAARPTPEELWRQALDGEEEEEEIPLEHGEPEEDPDEEPEPISLPPLRVVFEDLPGRGAEPPDLDIYVDEGPGDPEEEPDEVGDYPEDPLEEPPEERKQRRKPRGKPERKPPRPAKTRTAGRRGSEKVLKIVLIVMAAALLLGLGGGFLYLKMNAGKAPERAAQAFVDAVNNGDSKTVLAMIETSGSGLSSAEDAKKLIEDMRENLSMSELRDHLLAKSGDVAAGYDERYSCFTLREVKNNLISQLYKVKISPVRVVVQTDVPDVTFQVDGKKVQTEQTDGGYLIKTAPGVHIVSALYGGYGPEYELGSADFTSFSATTESEVSVSRNASTVEIELAGTETNLQILVDNQKTSLSANGGFITLNPAFDGMVITVKCDQYSQDFTVEGGGDHSFSADYIAEVEQESQNADGSAPDGMTNRQLLGVLAPRFYSFYQSYLEAINQWDKTLIKGVSKDYETDLIAKMEAYNKDLRFDFHGMTFDRRSIARNTKNGELFATFNVQVDFNYAKKSTPDQWLAGGNYQIVTMHYNGSSKTWEVYGTVIKDSLELSSDTFTINP